MPFSPSRAAMSARGESERDQADGQKMVTRRQDIKGRRYAGSGHDTIAFPTPGNGSFLDLDHTPWLRQRPVQRNGRADGSPIRQVDESIGSALAVDALLHRPTNKSALGYMR